MYIKQQYSGYDLLFLKLSYEKNKISGKKKNTLQTLGTKLYTSLEWCLNSPPKPHGFASFPLQSGLNIKTLLTFLGSLIPLGVGFSMYILFKAPGIYIASKLNPYLIYFFFFV